MTQITLHQQRLHYGTSVIDYSIVRSRRRKTSEIIVDAKNVIIRAPYDKPIEEIREIIRGKAKWIRTKQSEYKLAKPEIARPIFQEGSTLPYLGKNFPFRIVRVDNNNEKAELHNNVFLIFLKSSGYSKEHVRNLYESWLLGQAYSIFKQKTEAHCTEMGIKPAQVVIKKLKNRWGSATKHHVINLNVNLLKAPESVIEYIVLHELCHLKIKEHSHHFWDLLHKFMPDYKKNIKWLESNGRNLVQGY
jgi:predicted metal-dependent hydrolase